MVRNYKLLEMVKEVKQTSLAPLAWNEVNLLACLSAKVGRE